MAEKGKKKEDIEERPGGDRRRRKRRSAENQERLATSFMNYRTNRCYAMAGATGAVLT